MKHEGLPGRPTVLIAEDFVLLQEAMRDLLEPEFEVVAAVEDGQEALDAVRAHHPEVLLVDVSLPRIGGFGLAENVCTTSPATVVIFVTAYSDPAYVEKGFALGAKGWVMKSSIRTELCPAIRTALAGGTFRSRVLMRRSRSDTL